VTSLLGRDLFDPATLVVAVSQSGSSPDLVATVQSARRSGSPTLSLTNDPTSDLARAADVHIDLCAGPEHSVAATKTYTAEVVALHAWVRLAVGEPFDAVRDDVVVAAAAGTEVVARSADVARAIARELEDDDRVLVIGRGYSLSTAKEAALKLIETCAVAASGWSAADAKHGPLGQVVAGTPVFLLGASAFGRDSVLAVAPDVLARGGRVYGVGATVPDAVADERLAAVFPPVHDALVPALEIIPLQLVALELALLRGYDPDRPTGLTKVTRTL
jgi:glucosamine--fructose-6-phosphate aminotransferase (isomerizing)